MEEEGRKSFNFRVNSTIDYEEGKTALNKENADTTSLVISSHTSSANKTTYSYGQVIRDVFPDEPIEEDKRLANWGNWIERRKKMHARLGNALNRKPPSLIMNSTEDRRLINEQKEVLELAQMYFKPDKYRGNPFFWHSPILLSNKGKPHLPDCALTLRKRDKGIFRPIDYVNTPVRIRKEKDIYGSANRITAEKVWRKSDYLLDKRIFLRHNLYKVQKHEPRTKELIIEGKKISKPLESDRKRVTLPVLSVSESHDCIEVAEDMSVISLAGPDDPDVTRSIRIKIQNTILVCKQIITNKMKSKKYHCLSDVPCKFDLVYNAQVNEQTSQTLRMENLGTTKFKYSWKPIGVLNKSGLPISTMNFVRCAFFFNKNDGIILPGQIVEIEVWFHSRCPGIFKEVWELSLVPRVTDDKTSILFRFWGLVEEKPDDEYEKIEAYLLKRQRESAARFVVDNMLNRVITLDLPCNRGYTSIYFEEKYFSDKNPGYFYHPTAVENLRQLYKSVIKDTTEEWDLNLKCLQELIIVNISDPFIQSEKFSVFQDNVKVLLEPCPMARHESAKHTAVRSILCQFANKLEKEANELKIHYPFIIVSSPNPETETKRPGLGNKKSTETRRASDKGKLQRKGSRMKGSLSSKMTSSSKLSIPESKTAVVERSIDNTKYVLYRETLLLKARCLLGTAVEQISATLDSLNSVE